MRTGKYCTHSNKHHNSNRACPGCVRFCSYGANGNLTSDGSTTFTYDVENRLISATGAKNATLTYDPRGRLYEVSSPSGTTRFLYDSDASTLTITSEAISLELDGTEAFGTDANVKVTFDFDGKLSGEGDAKLGGATVEGR